MSRTACRQRLYKPRQNKSVLSKSGSPSQQMSRTACRHHHHHHHHHQQQQQQQQQQQHSLLHPPFQLWSLWTLGPQASRDVHLTPSTMIAPINANPCEHTVHRSLLFHRAGPTSNQLKADSVLTAGIRRSAGTWCLFFSCWFWNRSRLTGPSAFTPFLGPLSGWGAGVGVTFLVEFLKILATRWFRFKVFQGFIEISAPGG